MPGRFHNGLKTRQMADPAAHWPARGPAEASSLKTVVAGLSGVRRRLSGNWIPRSGNGRGSVRVCEKNRAAEAIRMRWWSHSNGASSGGRGGGWGWGAT